jgi:hypothetical protein
VLTPLTEVSNDIDCMENHSKGSYWNNIKHMLAEIPGIQCQVVMFKNYTIMIFCCCLPN